jgi:methyl-accepting chemotaxis protein
MVDRQTEGIAHSTSLIQTSVDRVKAGLSDFAGDARDNGGKLIKAQKRLSHLEMLSNNMLDTLANSGAEIDDTPMILLAQEAMRKTTTMIEHAIDGGEISLNAVFDRNYVLIEGTNPPQYDNGFCDFADKHLRPMADRIKARDPKIIACAITNLDGYLPTHHSDRSHKQGPDPVWNDANCRNKRIFMDEVTRRACDSEKPVMLSTYRMVRGGNPVTVKSLFLPFYIKGRRWGNFELAYRDV